MTSVTGTLTGAPDFLSAQQWADDPGAQLNLNGSVGGTPTGLFACSQFANTIFAVVGVANNVRIQIIYWSDRAQTLLVGTRQFNASSVAGPGSSIAIPNQGKFFSLLIFTAAPQPNAVQLILQPSNRAGPTNLAFNQATLVEESNVAIGAGASVLNSPNTLYTGPTHLEFNCAFAVGTVQVLWLDVLGVFHPVYSFTFAANPGDVFRSPLFVPYAPLTVAVNNATAAPSTFNAYLVPDQFRLTS